MKILIVSNLYPPHYIGGYELGCKYAVDKLRARGHNVEIITSTYGVSAPEEKKGVHRVLQYSPWGPLRGKKELFDMVKKEARNQRMFRKIAEAFGPDLVYIWNLAGTSVSLAFLAEAMFPSTCYFISDSWLARIARDPWYAFWERRSTGSIGRALKKAMRSILAILNISPVEPPLKLDNVHFVSNYLREDAIKAGVKPGSSQVIYWGVDIDKFPYNEKTEDRQKKILYVGHITELKGIETVIKAADRLMNEYGYEDLDISVLGRAFSQEYETYIQNMVSSLKLNNNIHFAGAVPHEEVVKAYREHDILIFPSVWGEPFSITLLEGLASGLAVVGTPSGGSSEILKDGDNSFVFEVHNDEVCAAKAAELLRDGQLYETIRKNGRSTIEADYTLDGMIDTIEKALFDIVYDKNAGELSSRG